MLFGHAFALVAQRLNFYRPACQCLVSFCLAYMWGFFSVRIFILVSVRLCVSLVIFLHTSQASMALVNTWLVVCQVKKVNMPQEM